MPELFDLDIIFTGICTLVTNRPIANDPERMHLVVVDGWADSKVPDRPGVDEVALPCRHGAMIQFPLANLPGAGSAGGPRLGQGIWYPKRHSLQFTFEEEPTNPPELNEFRVHPDLPGHIADMTLIAPGFASLGASDVLDVNPHPDVLANALFERGELLLREEAREDWQFPAILSPAPVVVTGMAFEVILRLRRLTGMTLTASRLQSTGSPRDGNPGKEEPDSLRLVAAGPGETVCVTIAVGCEENPLLWQESKPARPSIDEDFRWHYEIFSQPERNRLQRALGQNKLPVPERQAPAPLANGRNCFPAFFTA